MEKGSPTLPEPTLPPDPTRVHIELEYDMLASGLTMKGKHPTVVMAAVLRKAELAKPRQIEETNVAGPRRVIIDYDMKDDTIRVQTDAAPLIYLGILVMAHYMITQNQVLKMLRKMTGGPVS